MLQLLKLALRDLGRNRRRSLLSALALGIGLALLLLMASVVAGEIYSSLDSAIKMQSGHLQVTARNYNEDKASLVWEDLIADPEQVAAQIALLAPVQVATPRLFASGIAAVGDRSVGVRIIGIDPPSTANAPFRDGLISGAFLTADDRQGILIGQPLAEKLNLKAGETINLLANTSNGDVDQQPFVVRGIYTTHTPGYDEGAIFMPLAKAQALTKTENHASTIFVLLKDRDQTSAVAAALRGDNYHVKTWEEMNALVLQFEDFANVYIYVLYLIVLAITATVIINTLIMSVFERTREIGILAAMGMKGSRIMAMFFTESSLLAIGGIVIGLILGGLMVAYATLHGFYIGNYGVTGMLLSDTIYGRLTLKDTIVLSLIAYIVSLLAALYPAMLAARMEPVDALHGSGKLA
ncbi:MAG: ABC transporter permease [Chloroflexi bacterium]|nr:ABC transporter permease [Chloroflexota bacterium]MCL5275531.1 ABC transporter permease [Chloroflexota bacterium]